ncbi:hypothetical protein F5Y19DRAFT_483451 [Xylariaceae sp. FL1651]|nr:hypothetical protein F5Y19DRAFT_483451 [Xylariaceae sp. FL1651]
MFSLQHALIPTIPLLENPFSDRRGEGMPDAVADSSNTFTRANVFGLFLTLSICLLIQPIGSFLFARPSGSVGRVLFFFWRLNPIACIVEAVFLLATFCDGVLEAIKGRQQPEYACLGFWTRVRISLAAVSLLREQCRVLESTSASCYDEWRRGPFTMSSLRMGSHDATGAAKPTSITNGHDPVLSDSLDRQDDGTSHPSGSPVRNSVNITDRVADILELSRSPVKIPSEAQTRTPSSPLDSARSEAIRHLVPQYNVSTTLFSATLRRNGYRHTELVIKVLNILSLILLITKISFVTAPSTATIPAWFMLVHLTVSQVLSLGQAQGQLQGVELQYLEYRAVKLSRMENRDLLPILSFALLPLSHYSIYSPDVASKTFRVLYVALFPPLLFLDGSKVNSLYKHLRSVLATAMIFVSSLFRRRQKIRFGTGTLSPRQQLFWPWWTMGWFSLISNCLFDWAPRFAQAYDSWLAKIPVIFAYDFLLECYAFLPMLSFPARWGPSKWYEGIPLFWNIAVPLSFLIYGIRQYDDSQTYKPS